MLNVAEDTPFLQGRAFVFASQYASNLPDGLVAQYIAAAVHVLESPTVPVTVKVSAVKTIKKSGLPLLSSLVDLVS